ncbi:hypothetical protein ACLMJK_004032 [Lecanora helva]
MAINRSATMDHKPPASSLCMFKETRASLEPSQPGSLVQIQVPSTSAFSVRSRQHRRILQAPPSCSDEDTFKAQCLANTGSLYFGKSRRYPRTFLWRVLGDGKKLELCSVDISKSSDETREAFLTLQLFFPEALNPNCIALADARDQDSLTLFALTKGNELYTLVLKKDFFCYAAASEEDISKWCKVARPATFSISTPHKLIVSDALQLVVALCDGRLLMLKRNQGEDGSKWIETAYGDGIWARSLRGLVPFRGSNTIKYDGNVLEQETPIALAVAPDKHHVFAVCANHTLRIWNPNRATNVFSKDLLGEHREPHEIHRVMLDPGSPNVLQIFQSDGAVEGDLYYVVTFSPHDFGQFKFWGIRDPDHGEKGVRDLFPDDPLKPPDPDPNPDSKAIWKVADFRVEGGQDGNKSQMWILMRSNRRYKLYNLQFDILELAVLWQDQWVTMASESLDQKAQPQVSDLDPQDATDKWLEFMFEPDKYPDSVLEAAIGVYCSERSISSPNNKAPLEERMCSAIASQTQSLNSESTLANHCRVTDQEWTAMWQDVRDLDKIRWEPLSLEYDGHARMPWIAFADGCSAVRTCDRIELMNENSSVILAESMGQLETPSVEIDQDNGPRLPDELAVIIEAATTFNRNFSYPLRNSCNVVLAEELWLDPSDSVPLRIQAFYDRCNFSEEIGSVIFDELTNCLAPIGGFDRLETDVFMAILDELSYRLPEDSSGLLHTVFGRRLLINGIREMIDLRGRMLSDLLTLVVFVDMEIDREEMPMEKFDASPIYLRLLDLLKQCHISQWLVGNKIVAKGDSSHAADDKALKVSSSRRLTVLENLFALDLPAASLETQSQSEALTSSIKDLLQWVIGGNEDQPLEDVPVYIQTYLLANQNIDLASNFLRYQPSTAWSTYIKGRLFLLQRQPAEAATCFKKAAFKLSRPSSFDYHSASHSLLTPLESVSFGNGLPTYYTHILNLFDSHSHPTQMALFAHLALQLIPTPISTTNVDTTTTHPDQRPTLLTSLFQASLQTSDFPSAYSALTRHPAPETLLPSFISALLTTPTALPQLLSLPFPPTLHAQIDTILSSPSTKCSPKILASWRLHHNDPRGAAAALLPSLLQEGKNKRGKADGGGGKLANEYLAVINLLACAGGENGWVLSRDGGEGGKRGLVTIGDVRGGYQGMLDRESLIASGKFAFGGGGGGGGGEEMDLL